MQEQLSAAKSARQAFNDGGVMFKAVLRYVPLIPLSAAVLLFLLMPFERSRDAGGELLHVPRLLDQLDV
jgi:hypothetical protein